MPRRRNDSLGNGTPVRDRPVTVHPVTESSVDDWLSCPSITTPSPATDWAACYCPEPHVPATPDQPRRWRETRATVAQRLRGGDVESSPTSAAGPRAGSTPRGGPTTACTSYDPTTARAAIGDQGLLLHRCLPFRRHGVASALLDRVIADASPEGRRGSKGIRTTGQNRATPDISADHDPCMRHALELIETGTLHGDARPAD